MRRVPYHQSLFDLLGYRPAESAAAREMIAECERDIGRRLPESLRQWCMLENVVPLFRSEEECLWRVYSNGDHPTSLESVVRQIRGRTFGGPPPDDLSTSGRVHVLSEKRGGWCWYVPADRWDDPPVYRDDYHVALRFSAFLFDWFAFHSVRVCPVVPALWAFAPDADPAAPPHIDYLIDHLGDPHVDRAEEAAEPLLPFAHGLDSEPWPQVPQGGVTRYVFGGESWYLSVTTDAYGSEGGVSAWWLSADTETELSRLAGLAAWAGDVGEKLCRYPTPDGEGRLPTVGRAPTFSPAWLRWETDPVEACVSAVGGGCWR